MAEIIRIFDLPSAVVTAVGDQIYMMVDGANAKATRVAPCLVKPSTEWVATTAYAVGDKVLLSGGQSLQATEAGTSDAAEPAPPSMLGETVVDGTVTWELVAPTGDQLAEAKLVLIGAISRWSQAGSGAYQQQTAGPFGVTMDTRQRTGYHLWPSEISDLQGICKNTDDGSAFSVDTVASCTVHDEICSLVFGATYCSCGADIAGEPIFGVG